MIGAKRLAQMARKWQRLAALASKSLMPTPAKEIEEPSCSTSSVAGKGHYIVYSADGRWFEVPLVYLGTTVFSGLLDMLQAEFSFLGIGGKSRCPVMPRRWSTLRVCLGERPLKKVKGHSRAPW
jgi:hypothetical protein